MTDPEMSSVTDEQDPKPKDQRKQAKRLEAARASADRRSAKAAKKNKEPVAKNSPTTKEVKQSRKDRKKVAKKSTVTDLRPDAIWLCLTCGSCNTAPASSRFVTCGVCSDKFCFARCPNANCGSAVVLPGVLASNRSVIDPHCGIQLPRASWNRNLIDVATYVSLINPPPNEWLHPDRRSVSGLLVSFDGIIGAHEGMPCTIVFRKDSAYLETGTARTGFQNQEWKLSQIQTLKVGGPGEVTTKTGGGWIGGGIGVEGIAAGMLFAGAMNAITTKKSTSMQTVVEFVASGSGVVLLNQRFRPLELHGLLAPTFTRIRESQLHGPGSAQISDYIDTELVEERLSKNLTLNVSKYRETENSESDNTLNSVDAVTRVHLLKQLGELRESGILTEAEFQLEKRKILESPNF